MVQFRTLQGFCSVRLHQIQRLDESCHIREELMYSRGLSSDPERGAGVDYHKSSPRVLTGHK